MKTKSNNLKRTTRQATTLTDVLRAKEIVITDAQGFPAIYKGADQLKASWTKKTKLNDQEIYKYLHELIKKDRVWVKV